MTGRRAAANVTAMRCKILMTTAPDESVANALAEAALEDRLAACVQMTPGVTSRYWWRGVLESATEWVLTFKTAEDRLEALQERLLEAHPYETPECVIVPVEGGAPAYLDWVRAETRPEGNPPPSSVPG